MNQNRRSFLKTAAVGAVAPLAVNAQRDWTGANPVRYPDADIVVLDPRFAKYKIGNTPIQRLHTGMLWAEGTAWNGVGKYLVWSDIPNNVQMRWLEEDGHVSVMRHAVNNSNGNTFDWEGRQLSCEHLGRRVTRSTSITARSPFWPTNGKASRSMRRTTPSSIPMEASGSLIPVMASS